jgi:hypothetical protein
MQTGQASAATSLRRPSSRITAEPLHCPVLITCSHPDSLTTLQSDTWTPDPDTVSNLNVALNLQDTQRGVVTEADIRSRHLEIAEAQNTILLAHTQGYLQDLPAKRAQVHAAVTDLMYDMPGILNNCHKSPASPATQRPDRLPQRSWEEQALRVWLQLEHCLHSPDSSHTQSLKICLLNLVRKF